MDESILNSIKKPLGLENDYVEFDGDLVMLINGSLMTLAQNGVGKEGFRIDGDSQTWTEFLGNFTDVESAKSYVYLETRVLFDPPSTSAVIEAFTKQADEYLWRCREQVEILRLLESDDESDTGDEGAGFDDETDTGDEGNTDTQVWPTYTGEYTVIPKVESQTLYTDGMVMEDDVQVTEIPIFIVSSTSGGQTATIGGV